jgi:hypothetical protein
MLILVLIINLFINLFVNLFINLFVMKNCDVVAIIILAICIIFIIKIVYDLARIDNNNKFNIALSISRFRAINKPDVEGEIKTEINKDTVLDGILLNNVKRKYVKHNSCRNCIFNVNKTPGIPAYSILHEHNLTSKDISKIIYNDNLYCFDYPYFIFVKKQ